MLTTVDYDGLRIVDFLGNGMKAEYASDGQVTKEVKQAWTYVSAEYERFRATDPKLAGRYWLLKDYFDRNIDSWRSQDTNKIGARRT